MTTQLVPQPTNPYTTSSNGAASPLGNVYTKLHQYQLQDDPASHRLLLVARAPARCFAAAMASSTASPATPRSTRPAWRTEFTSSRTTTFPVRPPARTDVYPNSCRRPAELGVLFTPPGPPLAAPFAGALMPTVQRLVVRDLSFRGQDQRFTNPYTHSFDLAVEQELPWSHQPDRLLRWYARNELPYFIDSNQPKRP